MQTTCILLYAKNEPHFKRDICFKASYNDNNNDVEKLSTFICNTKPRHDTED